MAKILLDENEDGRMAASFEVESAILKEIGEQLVGNSETALTELIKNSYDADASVVYLDWSNKLIRIEDNGHGMSEDEFLTKWMRVGTSNKIKRDRSKRYKRNISGSKGVGRFAVRFLGDVLKFESVADVGKSRTKITATFDWKEIDKLEELDDVRVEYTLEENVDEEPGTRLTISDLKSSDNFENSVYRVKNNLLSIETPLTPIISDLGFELVKRVKSDPGFNFLERTKNGVSMLELDDDESNQSESIGSSIGALILQRYVARVKVDYAASTRKLTVTCWHKTKTEPTVFSKKVFPSNELLSNVIADIRFFPKRKDVMTGIPGVNGTKAYQWIKGHSGIGVYDRGFRVPPYGYSGDDWLYQSEDQSRSERNWRTELMKEYFPMDDEIKTNPGKNYMLNLARPEQSIGVVFVESDRRRDERGLTPNMDRRGFKFNAAFDHLIEITRFALEYMAMIDKQIILEEKEREIRQKNEETRKDILEAVRLIKKTTSLTPEDKAKIVDQYQYLSRNIDDLESYDRDARESLETMSLMGVIAGFMTHEYQSAIDHLESASALLDELSQKDERFLEYKSAIDKSTTYFINYIEYTRAFVTSLNKKSDPPFKCLSRVLHVTNTFMGYCNDHNIEVETQDIDSDLDGPRVPLALYQGIVLNLFTNAIKALISHQNQDRRVRIVAWNEGNGAKKKHIIQVMDNGPGIPGALQNRIWDPLFTTTSNENNPLGSGMGLGLSLLKKVVKQRKGVINLVDAPKEFVTCFRVELPFQA